MTGEESGYSMRSTLIGEIAAAHLAGMMAANKAHAAKDPAIVRTTQNDTPDRSGRS